MQRYLDGSLSQRLLQLSDACRRKQKFCDVTIETRSGPVSSHRLVLAAASPILDRILSSSNDQSLPIKLDLSSMDGSAVSVALDFAYTGKLEITSGNCGSVASVAKALEMEAVLDACVVFCKQNASIKTCLDTWHLAQDLELPDLVAFSDRFFSCVGEAEKEELMKVEAFPRLPRLRLELEVISGETECDPTQTTNAAVDFLRVNYGGCLTPYMEEVMRIAVAPDGGVMTALRDSVTPTTSPNRRFVRQGSESEVSTRSAARRLMLGDHGTSGEESEDVSSVDSDDSSTDQSWKVLTILSSRDDVHTSLVVLDGQLAALSLTVIDPLAQRQSLSPSPPQSVRSSCSSSSVQFLASLHTARCSMGVCVHNGNICAVGGYNRSDCLNTMETYDHEVNNWSVASQLNSRRGRCGAASLNGYIYCFGGSDGHNVLKSAEVFDTTDKAWQSISSMTVPRSRLCSAVLDGCIYAIGGGSCIKDPLRTMEIYDPVTNTWTHGPSLCEPRADAGVAVLNRNIYIVGGSNQWSSLSSVECFDSALGTWGMVPSLQTPRRGAGVVSLNGKVYVIGGHDSMHSLDSVEVYDPVTQKWSCGSPMSTPRANMAAVVLDGLIFAIGGFNGATFLNTMEYYNPDDSKWHLFVSV